MSPRCPPPSFESYHARPYLPELDGVRALSVLGRGALQALLRRPALVAVGKLSYGVYLLHVLGIVLAHKVAPAGTGRLAVSVLAYALACGLSLAAAWVLAVSVEKRCIEAGRAWSRRVLEQAGRRTPVAATWQQA